MFVKKKAGAVDVRSFWNMKDGLDIGTVNHRELFAIMSGIGLLPWTAGGPHFVMPRLANSTLAETVARFGFHPVVVDAPRDEDDQYIREFIRALDPENIGEFILLSADGGYAPILREQQRQGLKAYILASTASVNGRAGISEELLVPEFTFVDLVPFRDRITLKKAKKQTPVITESRAVGEVPMDESEKDEPEYVFPVKQERRKADITLEISDADPETLRSTMEWTTEFLIRHPWVTMTVKIN